MLYNFLDINCNYVDILYQKMHIFYNSQDNSLI